MNGQGLVIRATPRARKTFRKGGPEALPTFRKLLQFLVEGRPGKKAQPGGVFRRHYGNVPIWYHKASRFRLHYTMEDGHPLLLGFVSRADSTFYDTE